MHHRSLTPERQCTARDILARLSPYNPERVIFFGSFARNESDELSDIDLVVIKETDDDFFPYFFPYFFPRIRKVLKILDLKTAIDVLVYTPTEFQAMQKQGNVLVESIMEEGIVLDA